MRLASVIIPVHDKWELTRNCLKSIAAATKPGEAEVIVVDNASSDVTARACPFLGKELFGEAFVYARNGENRNFAGASNQGARLARGEFLVFLHNGIEVQPGWLQPLLADFDEFPGIAATGPLLLGAQAGPLGRLVRHLGLLITPFGETGHLYEGIPAASPLAQKRRFFQAIADSCMVMRKSLFAEAGGFCEDCARGFEDVDLCARLCAMGLRMTVNPESMALRQEGQSADRHARNDENYARLKAGSLKSFKPDWDELLRADGLCLGQDAWLGLQARMTPAALAALNEALPSYGMAELKDALVANPFWEKGWQELLAGQFQDDLTLFKAFFRLFRTPANAFLACNLGRRFGDGDLAQNGFGILQSIADSPHKYLQKARADQKRFAALGLDELAAQCGTWIDGFASFEKDIYAPFARRFLPMLSKAGIALNPENENYYNLWRFGRDIPLREDLPAPEPGGAAFSILMPAYNPDPEFFRAALDSILAQTFPDWELCLAGDAAARQIIKEYMARDRRVRAVFRESKGHMAEAAKSALQMAGKPWCLLVDQHDLLTPDALARMAAAMADKPQGMLFYSDADTLRPSGDCCVPYFKNGNWDWELLPAQNFVSHLAACRTDRLKAIGGGRDHEMLFRYVRGLDAGNLIHVPHVLCHRRVHAESAIFSAYALANSGDVAQAWLDAEGNGGRACPIPHTQWQRAKYPPPPQRPLVSLVCMASGKNFDIAAHAAALRSGTDWPLELIYACGHGQKEALEAALARAGEAAALHCGPKEAADLNGAVERAGGQILGFLDCRVLPQSEDWLAELVSSLCRPGVGAVGGAVFLSDGSLAHGGWLADPSGSLRPVLCGPQWPDYFGWKKLARTVAALDGLCLFCRRENFDGFDEAMGGWQCQDFCLRLAARGLRSVWWPFARLRLRGAITPKERRTPQAFAQVWRLPPFNKNLEIGGTGFSLSMRREIPSDFHADEYLRLYPEVAATGLDPYDHYLRMGKRMGRKRGFTRIDYSGLEPQRISDWQNAPDGDVVVCTALTGDYERLLPPAHLNDGWKYVCYTDQPRENWGIWELRDIPYEHADLARRSRWPKLNLPLLFPRARWVIWQDANIVIAGDLSFLLANRPEGGFLFSSPHPARDCIYDEGKACIYSGKEKEDILLPQLRRYQREGLPEHWGLYENGMFLLAPGHALAAPIFAQWWREYEKYGKRDQISLPYVCFRNGIRPGDLFPHGQSFRRRPEVAFLTHEETLLANVPEALRSGKEINKREGSWPGPQ